MDIIDNYLDVMFSSYPHTPQVAEAKAELRAMMEDVYNGALSAGKSQTEAVGQAIAEFGSIEEVAPLLGMGALPGAAPEVLVGEETGAYRQIPAQLPLALPPISLRQAQNFVEVRRQTRWMLGWAVALFVLGSVPLLSLSIATSNPNFALTGALAGTLGIAVIIPTVAAGVGMLIWRSQKLKPFNLINEGRGTTTPEVEAYAYHLMDSNAASRTRALVIAVVLWVLAGLPLIVAGVFTQEMPQIKADQYIAVGMAATLILVAAGLLVFLPANWAHSAGKRLTAEGLAEVRSENYSDVDRYPAGVRGFFAGYWPLMVVLYLSWSFVGNAWGISWIIWPIAGVLFAAIAAVLAAVYPVPREQRSR
ncbi:permease prefix domain 1-containing protein [Actinomyces minihominis]|uniref:permease prefix domain 1-containing protein n=1 Tax=Actinomyces minihominis TaxID=2002838 RepID=UPI000C08BBD6|nr:permease prefix domain 1-containing protein [Actinomyces minihominis]